MIDILHQYKNGNYTVCIYQDGSKIRWNNEDYFAPQFPESIDMKISNRCDMGCAYCHEQSTHDGAIADLNHPLLDSLHPGMELALGGGNVLENPGLEEFLVKMRDKGIICNITLHVEHFRANFNYIQYLVEQRLVYGVGVSVNNNINLETINLLRSIPNAVVHCIAGVVQPEVLEKMALNDLKLLLLGYKNFGRGVMYKEKDENYSIGRGIEWLRENLAWLRDNFKLVSFDNLALQQLHVREFVGEEAWSQNYMGDDGQFTMYVDLVEKTFAKSSISERMPICNDNIDELFARVRSNC